MRLVAGLLSAFVLSILAPTAFAAPAYYSFTFNGSYLDGQGQFFITPDAPGTYTIYSSGAIFQSGPDNPVRIGGNGANGPEPVGSFGGNDNLLFDPGPELDQNGITWRMWNGDLVNLSNIAGQNYVKFLPLGASQYLTETVSLSIEPPPAPAPEPSSFILLGSGLLGMAGIARYKFFPEA